jgi:hypothetical protein
MPHLGIPFETVRAKMTAAIPTSTPSCFPLRSDKRQKAPSISSQLHHTWRNHHEQRGKGNRLGATERGKEGQPIFMERSCDNGRRHTLISLYPLVPLLTPFGSRPREMAALDVEAIKGIWFGKRNRRSRTERHGLL